MSKIYDTYEKIKKYFQLNELEKAEELLKQNPELIEELNKIPTKTSEEFNSKTTLYWYAIEDKSLNMLKAVGCIPSYTDSLYCQSYNTLKFIIDNFNTEIFNVDLNNLDYNHKQEINFINKEMNDESKAKLYFIIKNNIGKVGFEELIVDYKDFIKENKINILYSVLKTLTKGTIDNQRWVDIQNRSESDKKKMSERSEEHKIENEKKINLVKQLIEIADVNPFKAEKIVYYLDKVEYAFSQMLAHRTNDLIELSISKFPEDFKEYAENKGILKQLAIQYEVNSNYYQPFQDDPDYYYPNYLENKLFELFDILLKNNYNFFEKEMNYFKIYLNGRITVGKYGDKSFTWDIKPYNDYIFTHKEYLNGLSLYTNTTSYEDMMELYQNDLLGDVQNLLKDLINNFCTNGDRKEFSYILETELDKIKITPEYKTLKLIELGHKLKVDDALSLFFKNLKFNLKPSYSSSQSDSTNVMRILFEYDSIEDRQMFEEGIIKKLKKEFPQGEGTHYNDYLDIVSNYKDIIGKTIQKYQNTILELNNKVLSQKYINTYFTTKEEIYTFLSKDKSMIKKDDKGIQKYDFFSYHSIGSMFLENKNWEGVYAIIDLIKEHNLLPDRYFSFGSFIDIYKTGVPKKILNILETYVISKPGPKKWEYAITNFFLLEMFNNGWNNIESIILQDYKSFNNIQDKYSKTLFMERINNKDITLDECKFYIEKGYKVGHKDKYNKNALEIYLKSKPSELNIDILDYLLMTLKKEGQSINIENCIKLIKPKKYVKWHEKIENFDSIEVDIDDISEDDDEMVELTVYRTEKHVHYHKYSSTILVPKKDLVLDDSQLIEDYYTGEDEEYHSDWDSSEENDYELER